MSALPQVDPERIVRLTRDDYYALADRGAFAGRHVELIRGMVVEMMSPTRPRHASTVQRLQQLFHGVVGHALAIRTQLPLSLADDEEPEPDLCLVPPGEYVLAHPSSALLVVEVAETSLTFDLGLKATLYAEAAIPAYWVVDLAGRRVVVHGAPAAGRYQEVRAVFAGEHLAIPTLPELTLPVAEFFPPA